MNSRICSAALAAILLLGTVTSALAQTSVRSRIRAARVPIIVVKLAARTADSRIFFSETDLSPDTVFLSASKASEAELEAAIALVASERESRWEARMERGGRRSVGYISPIARWLPVSDQRRLAAFTSRLENSGTFCRRSADAVRDRCLPLALPSGSLFNQMRESRNFTLP